MISTVTSKGQITIPVDIRRAVGLATGSQVEFIVNARRRIELVPRQGDIRALRGCVPAPAAPVDVDAMAAAAAQALAGAALERPADGGAQAQSTYRIRLPPSTTPGTT